MPLMTQKAYAEKKGVSPQYVGKLVTQGKVRLVRDRKSGRMLVDSKQANEAIAAFRREGRILGRKTAPKQHRATSRAKKTGRPATDPHRQDGVKPMSATRSLAAARADREHYMALKAKLEYEESVKNYLPKQLVLDHLLKIFTTFRTRLRRMPRQLAPMIVRETTPAAAEKVMLEEIDLILSDLAANPLAEMTVEAVPAAPPEVVQASAVQIQTQEIQAQ